MGVQFKVNFWRKNFEDEIKNGIVYVIWILTIYLGDNFNLKCLFRFLMGLKSEVIFLLLNLYIKILDKIF